jgi:hypothetical protein
MFLHCYVCRDQSAEVSHPQGYFFRTIWTWKSQFIMWLPSSAVCLPLGRAVLLLVIDYRLPKTDALYMRLSSSDKDIRVRRFLSRGYVLPQTLPSNRWPEAMYENNLLCRLIGRLLGPSSVYWVYWVDALIAYFVTLQDVEHNTRRNILLAGISKRVSKYTRISHVCVCVYIYIYIYNYVAWVRERTIPTERLALVSEVSGNFCL